MKIHLTQRNIMLMCSFPMQIVCIVEISMMKLAELLEILSLQIVLG